MENNKNPSLKKNAEFKDQGYYTCMFFLHHNGKLFNVTSTYKITVVEGKRNFRSGRKQMRLFFLLKRYWKLEASYWALGPHHSLERKAPSPGAVLSAWGSWGRELKLIKANFPESIPLLGIWISCGSFIVKHMFSLDKHLLRVPAFNNLWALEGGSRDMGNGVSNILSQEPDLTRTVLRLTELHAGWECRSPHSQNPGGTSGFPKTQLLTAGSWRAALLITHVLYVICILFLQLIKPEGKHFVKKIPRERKCICCI